MKGPAVKRSTVVVENPADGWYVVAVKTSGAYLPLASCGDADRAAIVRRGLEVLIERDGDAIVNDILALPRVAVPGDPRQVPNG